MPDTSGPAAWTSVTYTRPASASPLLTLPSVDLTSASSLTGLNVTPIAFSIFSAAAPHGTWGAQTTTLRSGLARSANDAMPLGLPGAVAICRTFVAKIVGLTAARPASVTVFMVASLAAAKTSAGAPLTICWARSDDPAKLSFTSTPGWSASKCFSRLPKASVSDAAASTVTVPDSVAADGAADNAADGAGAAGWAPPPQPASSRARPATGRARAFTRFL